MSKLIGNAGMLTGSIGIFFGYYYLFANKPEISLKIITVTTVGLVGILAFVRHVIFHKEDAKRLGWETEKPDWMFEVGFANLAFGVIGLIAVFANLGMESQAITVLGYAIYLFQAGILHGYRYFTDEKRMPLRLWRFSISTLVYAITMAFFAIYSLYTK